MNYRAEVRGEAIRFEGVDFSNRKPLLVAARERDLIAVRHPGGSCWGGIAMPRVLIRAHVLVFRILKTEGAFLTLDRVMEIPLRAKATK